MSPIRVIFLTVVVAAVSGCGKPGGVVSTVQAQNDSQSTLPTGVFSDNRCIYNIPISSANSQALYSTDVISFNSDGTGEKDFSLYTDATCTTFLTKGSVKFTYSVATHYDAVSIVEMIQGDSTAANGAQTFYLPITTATNGYYFDVDGSQSMAGPYWTMPTAESIANFQADPAGTGVLYSEQTAKVGSL